MWSSKKDWRHDDASGWSIHFSKLIEKDGPKPQFFHCGMAKTNDSSRGLLMSKRLKKLGEWWNTNRAITVKDMNEATPKERPSFSLPLVRKIDLKSYFPNNDKIRIMGTMWRNCESLSMAMNWTGSGFKSWIFKGPINRNKVAKRPWRKNKRWANILDVLAAFSEKK